MTTLVIFILALAAGFGIRAAVYWQRRRRFEKYLRSLQPLDPVSRRVMAIGCIRMDVK